MKLGDKIEFEFFLKRKHSWDNSKPYGEKDRRDWREFPMPAKTTGIVIGVRTIKEGFVENQGEDGKYFVAQKYIKAYLVAFDINKNPVYVTAQYL